MTGRVDRFYDVYGRFGEQVLQAVRRETFGRDIGQNSWLTADEYDRLLPWLGLEPGQHVLEVASGSGGPARYLAEKTGCRVTGIDANESGVAAARQGAAESPAAARLAFENADATTRLPFDEGSFDAVVCFDSMNHFPERLSVFREWRRVLRPGRRALFTDPVVITGPVTNEELARRSSIGLFLFVPPGVNERLLEEAALRLVRQEDVTDNAVLVSGRWYEARQRHREALLRVEGAERFEGLQRFLDSVHGLTSEKRLSRIVYLAEKNVG